MVKVNAVNKEIEDILDKDKELKYEIKYKILKDFVKNNPNDGVLGCKVREYFLRQQLKRKNLLK